MKHIKNVILVTIVCLAMVCLAIVPALAQGDDVIDENLYVTNVTGAVNAVARAGNTIYIAGGFTYVGPNVGHGTAVDLNNNGQRVVDMPKVDGDINAVISDEAGGWYIGGRFSWVGGLQRTNVAHILADRSVDGSFSVTFNSGAFVKALLLDQTITPPRLYVAGDFYMAGGISRRAIVAVNAQTGSGIPSFGSPFGSGARDAALAHVGNKVFVSGRSGVYALEEATGSLVWGISISSTAPDPVPALKYDNGLLYIGGNFTSIGGQAIKNIAVADTNGTVTSTYYSVKYAVTDIEIRGSNLYVVGTSVDGHGATVYKIDLATSAMVWWKADINSSLRAVALSAAGDILYLGGYPIKFDGTSFSGIAAMDPQNGSMITSWNPPRTNGFVHDIALSGSLLYLGGAFTSADGVSREGLAALDATTGEVINWRPDLGVGELPSFKALCVYGSRLYAGGSFATVNGATRNAVAAFDLETKALTSWNPNVTGGVTNFGVYELCGAYGQIYIGGRFRSVGGQIRNGLASVDTLDGAVSSWFPLTSWWSSWQAVDEIYATKSRIYIGGMFNSVFGQPRSHLAAFNVTDGSLLSWAPSLQVTNAWPATCIYSLGVIDDRVYLGGYFTKVWGVTRNYLAAVDTLTGALLPWNPGANGNIKKIAIAGATIYAGGTFTSMGGYPRINFAALDEQGRVTNWNPNPSNQPDGAHDVVFAIDVWNNSVAIGGEFIDAFSDNGYQFRPNLVVMTDPSMLFKIHAVAEGGGGIDPPGDVEGNVYLYYDQSRSFSFAPAEGYVIDRIDIDGVSQGAIPDYTFVNVRENHDLVAHFIQRTNTAPILTAVPASATIDEMVLYTFDADAIDPEVPPQVLTFSLVNEPSGATIDPVTGIFTWTPTEEQGPRNYSFTVRVTDGMDQAEQAVILTVNEVNRPPTITDVPEAVTADELMLITFDANATDPDIPVQTLMFSLVDAPEGAAIDPSTGIFAWTSTEAQGPGTFNFKVRVTDGVTSTDGPVSITLNEVNVAPTLTDVPQALTEDELTLITFDANATDPDIPVQTLVFSLVDAPEGAAIDPSAGIFIWTATEAQGPGTFNFKVRVTDGVGASEAPVSITVDEVNIAPTLTDIPEALTADELTLITFDANATDPDLPAQTLVFSLVDAPDGAAIDPPTGIFTWTSTEAQGPGTFNFKVRVTDGLASTDAPVSVALREVNIAPTLTDVPGALTADELTLVTFDANATDPDIPVQSLVFSLVDAPAGATIEGGSGIFSWIPAESQGPASYSFNVRVSDGVTHTELPMTIVVNEVNLPPTLGEIIAPVDPMQVGTTIQASAIFTDLDIPIGVHTASWDWGDNRSSEGTIIYSGPRGTVSGDHSYSSAGVYVITLVVTDNYGATASATYYYVVVYDPSGGFVTGGGWIMSPAGAYRENVNLTGKATFGFVSKYLPGATVPSGNTEFQFKAGSLNFKSLDYEWLVVAGAKAQYKGTGTINGSGYYGFMLTSIDGQVNGGGGIDKFRIKIWQGGSTAAVVYDNKHGEEDTSSAATELGGGSIVIHKSAGGAMAVRQGIGEEWLPSEYALYQNYPNPFNPTTTIRFDLPQPSTVTLTVYSTLGQEIARVIDGALMDAGYQQVVLDGANLPTGIYFYKLQAGNFTSLKKFILLK